MARLSVGFALLLTTACAGPGSGPSVRPGPPAFDLSSLDPGADACTDFFQWSCGGWMAQNPIPGDQSRWGRFDALAESNRVILRGILEAAAGGERDADTQKIGDFYAACMDQAAIDAAGLAPIAPLLQQIAALSHLDQLPELLATLHQRGVDAFFAFGAEEDMKNSTQYIAGTDQAGLGLPDRDYYLRTDPSSVALREKYQAHLATMFRLAGDPAAEAKAAGVLAFETALAKASLDLVSRRDPNKLYHKLSVAELAAASPSFSWPRYFAALPAAPAFGEINVAVPDFVQGVEGLLASTPLPEIAAYLTWQTLHAAAAFLPKPFDDAEFEFYGKALAGIKEQKPRWKRCVAFTDGALGEALGRVYVEQTFGAAGKARMLTLVAAVEEAMRRDLEQLDWMTPATKAQALRKLSAIANKIGYPDTWRDYGALRIEAGDALGNAERAMAFELNRRLRKVGTRVDPLEWAMSPPTVNAYFHPLQNNINFPAGILQPPFFSLTADDAINFGGIGAVIGHELTHGFDDQGRQFDAAGNLRDWWSDADAKAFNERAACFVEQYAGYTAVDEVKLNGELTLGENVADNGGLRIALMALDDVQRGARPEPIDGFTPVQRLFLGWAQVWCQNITPQAARMRAQTDPHSLGRYRVNGVVSNMPEFREAFACPADAPMVRAKPCRVW